MHRPTFKSHFKNKYSRSGVGGETKAHSSELCYNVAGQDFQVLGAQLTHLCRRLVSSTFWILDPARIGRGKKLREAASEARGPL